MMTYQEEAIFGNEGGGMMTANMANPAMAGGELDWGAVLANGIRGAAQGAIGGMVQNAYASGQLRHPQPAYVQAQAPRLDVFKLALIGGAIYLLSKG